MSEKQLSNETMLSFEEIMQLIDKVSQSNIDEVTIDTEASTIVLKKHDKNIVEVGTVSASPVVSQAASAPVMLTSNVQADANVAVVDDANTYIVKSPIVGTFYASKEEGGEPLVKVGDSVKKESIVAIIEAMKLMNEITAGADGVIAEIMVENGQLVEYGQELMKIKF